MQNRAETTTNNAKPKFVVGLNRASVERGIRLRMYVADCDSLERKRSVDFWVHATHQLFGHCFGGSNVGPPQQAAYKSKKLKKLIFEKTWIVESTITETQWRKHCKRIEQHAMRYGLETAQEVVLLELGDQIIKYEF